MSPSNWVRQTGVIAHIDGASRGNPGPAAYGVVLTTAQGEPLAAFSKYLGRATNNVAEYQALLAALDYALGRRHLRLRVISDSELLVRQVEGRYKVKSPDLKPLHERVLQLVGRFEAFAIVYLPREQNREADRLANRALDGAEVEATTSSARAARRDRPAPALFPSDDSRTLRVLAIYRNGILKANHPLPLEEGAEVELEIRRRKTHRD